MENFIAKKTCTFNSEKEFSTACVEAKKIGLRVVENVSLKNTVTFEGKVMAWMSLSYTPDGRRL